ncbi:MAG: fumarylacetoacetate hydrolase family protein [Xanthobacteraceae bacterium]|nr:fumarylacetoacetate hydrolase family protein [Xanthobacteraceae bacterium]
MKLATYLRNDGTQAVGAVDTARGRILDLARAAERLGGKAEPAFSSMLSLIEHGEQGLARARTAAERWPAACEQLLSGTRLLSPLPVPQQIRDCLVFEQHLVNAMKTWEKVTGRPSAPISPLWYERPTWYKGNRFSFVGHEHDVSWPSYSEMMDFELELACVIGKKGRDLTKANALEYVFGYTIFNDFSARDTQMQERPLSMGPMKGKDFDTGNVLGPWIVTSDEIGDPHTLNMQVRVNGERWGGGNSRDMHHKFNDILAFVSREETLHPGEVIASGTVPTGCGLELNRFLKPNDIVELDIERIGILRNRIVRSNAELQKRM